MPFPSHLARMRPILGGLSAAGARVNVWTSASLRDEVERAGGRFFDLFARGAFDQLEGPGSSRRLDCVTFAGCYADQILDEVRSIRPSLVLYDSFAVIGYVVGTALAIPFVNVCAGHNVHAGAFLEETRARLERRVTEKCRRAVAVLRERYGIADASPYMVLHATSPFLNLYGEAPEFLDAAARRAFEPVACIGSFGEEESGCRSPPLFGAVPAEGTRVYVSFGTVVWRSFRDDALAAMRIIAEALAARPNTRAVFSLGGHALSDGERASINRANVQALSFVPQHQALREADAFITHHGLNSTHEAIHYRVPMISYPFHWDQPGLARTCQQLGIAIPLTAGPPRGAVTCADVLSALDAVGEARESLQARLSAVREYEERAIASRPAVIRRLLELATAGRS